MLPQGWNGDGIIARVNSPELAEQIAATGLPTVNCSTWRHDVANMTQCTVDEEAGGKLAAEHLIELGFRHFGYVPALHRPGYIDRLGHAFEKRLAEADWCVHLDGCARLQRHGGVYVRRSARAGRRGGAGR